MLNVMGDGGPFGSREWDEAVASMAICEEATIVFSAGASARMQMPFIGARKAPPGTVVVAEIGLIDVRRDGGRRREVNEWLTTKFVEERKQKKLDQLEDAKLVRLRDRRDRLEQSDLVQRLLTSDHEQKLKALGWQKDRDDDDDASTPAPASLGGGATDPAANPAANPADAADKEAAEPSAGGGGGGGDDDGDKDDDDDEDENDDDDARPLPVGAPGGLDALLPAARDVIDALTIAEAELRRRGACGNAARPIVLAGPGGAARRVGACVAAGSGSDAREERQGDKALWQGKCAQARTAGVLCADRECSPTFVHCYRRLMPHEERAEPLLANALPECASPERRQRMEQALGSASQLLMALASYRWADRSLFPRVCRS